MGSRKTRRYIEKRLSPTVAIATLPEITSSGRDDAWQKLAKELKGAGYSPQVIDKQAHATGAEAVSETAGNSAVSRENGHAEDHAATGTTRKRTVGRTGVESEDTARKVRTQ